MCILKWIKEVAQSQQSWLCCCRGGGDCSCWWWSCCGEAGIRPAVVVVRSIICSQPSRGTERGEGLGGSCDMRYKELSYLSRITPRQGHLHHKFSDLELSWWRWWAELESNYPRRGHSTAGQSSGQPVNIATVRVRDKGWVVLWRRYCGVTSSHLSSD